MRNFARYAGPEYLPSEKTVQRGVKQAKSSITFGSGLFDTSLDGMLSRLRSVLTPADTMISAACDERPP